MKKLSILFVLVMTSLLVMAQAGRIDLRSASRAEITESEFTSLRAVFSYGSIESIEVPSERGTFSEIALPGTYPSGEIGTPELPASHELLAVPFGATPRVTVKGFTATDYNLSDYGINTIVPHQPSVRKDQRPEDIEFVYDAEAYQTRGLANEPTATIEVQGTLRGIRIGSLVVNPVSYNPASNTLRVFNDIEVEVSFDGADYAETERMLVNTYSPYFDIVYQQMFNYRQIMDVYDDHPDLMAYPTHMVVIAPESHLTALEPWKNWKIQKGFDVQVYTTSQTGSTYSAIHTYVQNLYNTGVAQGATPTFLILVGDVAQIPGTTGSSSQKVTDLYYGSVDNDYFPDMFYSRMSAENPTQLTAIVNKILQYEQYTMPDPSYLNNVLLIAGSDNYWNPRVAQPTINYATTYYYNAAHGLNNVYAYLNSYSGCYNNLSTGVGFANYTAHGSETGWSGPSFSNSNVNSLTNANKYFLAMGNCCLTGNFGYSSPCFGEAMIRAENKGAYSYIGSCPVTYWYEDYYFGVGAHNTHGGPTPTQSGSSIGCYDGVWMDDTYNTVSSMVFVGNLAVCKAHTGGYQTHSNPTYYWQAYHVLGDGSIMPYRVNPTPNTVNHASSIPAGANTFTVSAEAGSFVGISQNNVLKGSALVPASGTVTVALSSFTSGQMTVVVTKPQRQPYSQTITVGGGGTTTYNINVSANPANGGQVSGGGTYNQGQSCTVTATPNSGYTFTNWTENGSVVSTNPTYSFNVNSNRTLVAHFTVQTTNYNITVAANPANGGTVSGGGTYQQGQTCTITAQPAANYTFLRWTKNGQQVSTNASYTFTVTENANYVAQFQAQTYSITATADPVEGGTITGTGTYNAGQSCTLTATPAPSYSFKRWTKNGMIVSHNPVFSFTVTESAAYVAHFQLDCYAPTNVTAEAINYTDIYVNWSAVPNAQSYKIYRNGTLLTSGYPEAGSYYDTELNYGEYCYTIVAECASGDSEQSEEACATLSIPCNGPEDFVADYVYEGEDDFGVQLQWNTVAPILPTYCHLYRSTDGGNFVLLQDVQPEGVSQHFTYFDPVAIGHYTYMLTLEYNFDGEVCVTDPVYVEAEVTAVSEQQHQVGLYPNPVNGLLTVESAENIVTLEVYNTMGTLVYTTQGDHNKMEINTSDLPCGTYVLRVTTASTVISRSFLKTR